MCEQSTVQYLEGDIVWVKLGSCWWPGEVQNITKLPKDVQDSFKKPPIAVVKFFKEDKYEFVKNLDHIYKYNCRKKHEFIKKGLDKHREKVKFMEKFPEDITYAEVMTNGDPEIINSAEFAPDKKIDYSAIFGDSSPKKSKSGKGRSSIGGFKHRSSLPAKGSSPVTPTVPRQVTHFRFIGFDDHEVQYREQKVTPSPPATTTYKCHSCEFKASRQNVIVLHSKSHMYGTYTSFSTTKKTLPTKKHKRSKPKRDFCKDETVKPLKKRVQYTAELSSEDSDEWDETDATEKEKTASPVKSPKKSPKRKNVKLPSPPPKKSKIDIKKKLLDDWEDEEDEEEVLSQKEVSKDENNESTVDNGKVDKSVDGDKNSIAGSESNDKTDESENKDKTVESCFDFVEEDQEIPVQNSSPGRKIPRVIPQNQKRLSLEVNLATDVLPKSKESDANESEKTTEKVVDSKKDDQDKSEEKDDGKVLDISTEVEDLLESTKVPEIPQILKTEKNFHDDKTIKFPDKIGAKTPKTSEGAKSRERVKSSDRMEVRSSKTSERLKSPDTSKVPEKKVSVKSPKPAEPVKSQEKVKSPEKLEVTIPRASERMKSPEKVIKTPEKMDVKSPRASERMKSPEKNKTVEVKCTRTSERMKSPEKIRSPEQMDVRSPRASERIKSPEMVKSPEKTEAKSARASDRMKSPEKPKSPEKTDAKSPKRSERMMSPEKIKSPEKVEPKSPKAPERMKSPEKVKSPEVVKSPKASERMKSPEKAKSPKSSPVVSPKIPNPKKRFVRSFADFESLYNNEQSKTSDTDVAKEPEPLESTFKVSDLKSQIMTKLHETGDSPKRETRSTRRSSTLKEKLPDATENLEKCENLASKSAISQEKIDVNGAETLEEESGVTDAKSETAAEATHCEPPEENACKTEEKPSGLSALAVAAEEITNAENECMKKNEQQEEEESQINEIASIAAEVTEHVDEKCKDIAVNEGDKEEEALKIDEILQKANSPVEEIVSPPKPVTLTSFSMDFSDSNNDSTSSFPCVEPVEAPKKDILSNETVEKDVPSEIIIKPPPAVTENNDTLNKSPVKPESPPKKVTKLEKENITSPSANENLNSIPETVVCAEEKPEESKLPEVAAESVMPNTESSPGSKLFEMLKETKQAQERNEGILTKTLQPTTPAVSNVIVKGAKKPAKIEPEKSKSVYAGRGGTPRIINEPPKSASKFVIKSTMPASSRVTESGSAKPIILSEKIIKPVSESQNVSVQKVSSKRTYQDVEDIDTFIIQKPAKKLTTSSDVEEQHPIKQTPVRSRGKAKILQQTIITPSGEVRTDTPASEPQLVDDNMFDINSMPIVLSDDILTAESLENMQVITDMPTAKTVEKPKQAITLLNKSTPKMPIEGSTKPSQIIMKNMQQTLPKNQRIYQTSSKLMKNNTAVITQPGKPGKYVIVPSNNAPAAGTKYTVGKRSPIIKTTPNVLSSPKIKSASGVGGGEEPSGNKIMIVTNKQGVQSRMLLTPSQQKLLGCSTGAKIGQKTVGKTVVHSKSILTSKGTILSPMSAASAATTSPKTTVLSHTVVNSKGQLVSSSPNLISADGQNLSPMQLQQLNKKQQLQQQGAKVSKIQVQQRGLVTDQSKIKMNTVQKPRTILIKNPQGEVIKKLQAPDDSVQTTEDLKNYYLKHGLGEQISESLAAQKQQLMPSMQMKKGPTIMKQEIKSHMSKNVIQQKMVPRRSYVKRPVPDTKQKQVMLSPQVVKQTEVVMPPLAPISPVKKVDSSAMNESALKQNLMEMPGSSSETDKSATPQKPLNQLVIQDAMGNQTTVTEGQILALPSETVDGQPQSYMLVTLDESGNLTPLNNEALLSLDPNLGLGGDLSNVVLQIDQSKEIKSDAVEQPITTEPAPQESAQPTATATATTVHQQTAAAAASKKDEQMAAAAASAAEAEQNANNLLTAPETSSYLADSITPNIEQATVSYSINSDTSQQIIISGDPISAQKFLESLSEGNTDISNLLANAEGNIIINTDGQQILINTADTENQMLLSVGNENLSTSEANTESDHNAHNPLMGATTKTSSKQDILAAALANTDVLQQDSGATVTPSLASKLHSQLSPNGSLYPSSVPNVLETSLTLGSPIMTPLEVPSVSMKKVSHLESDILSHVPKSSLELPITITDPNISQTVAQQQALLASEALSLPLTIADPGISATTSEMNSPSYGGGYSLPSLDDSSIQKSSLSSSISMPLLTEEPEPETKEEASLPVINETENENLTPAFDEPPAHATGGADDAAAATSTLPDVSPINAANEESPLGADVSPLDSSNLHMSMCMRSVPDMCNSLSEPPPDMFDMSFKDLDASAADVPSSGSGADVSEQNNALPNLSEEPLVSENSQLTDSDNLGSNFDSFGDERSSNNQTPLLNLTPENSDELNSSPPPARTHFDENSCEIPMQPPIVTDLTERSFNINNGGDGGGGDVDETNGSSSVDAAAVSKKRTIDDCAAADENAEQDPSKKHKLD